MTEAEAISCVAVLSEMYSHDKWSETRISTSVDLIVDLDYAKTKVAIAELLKTCKFPPTIAEIRKLALPPDPDDLQLPAGEAWVQVMCEVRRVGSWGEPSFSDPMILRAVQGFGGWQDLCASENHVADRAHFMKIYDHCSSYAAKQSTTRALDPAAQKMIADFSSQIGEIDETVDALEPTTGD